MRLISFLFILIGCLHTQLLQAQQTPKTLLWRISGNGFSKPCYLYGTMHSGDKRVYVLGDSVYNSIKICDGLAIELDPGEITDSLLLNIEYDRLNIGYKEAIENSQLKKDPGYYRTILKRIDSMINKMRERYNDLSPKDIRRLERAYKLRNRNDMNTTFDLYLFDLAKKQGKVVGGIEDYTDQSSLKDEFGNNFDPDLFLKNQRKKYVDVEEWMISNYVAADLDKIQDFSKQAQSPRQLSLILNNRNNKMARRIDSLGNIRSTFCAVGVAHLPGDSGVINLLRKKGFTVEPVFSSKKIEPGDIKIDVSSVPLMSISDVDSNYTVQMPGKPTSLVAITNKLYVRAYKELSNEILLMCGVYEDGDINKTLDKEVDEMKKFFTRSDAKILSSQKINRQNLGGFEFFIKAQKEYVKLHIFHKDGKTYMFAAGANTKDSVEAGRCLNYMATYKMNLDKPAGESEQFSFINAGKAFSVKLPIQPKIENISGTITETKQDITLFSSIDKKKKINYLVLVKEPFKGYFNDFDSSIFTETTNEVLKELTIKNIAEENVLLDNYPALKTRVRAEVDGKINVIYSISTIRNNRLYNLTVRGLAIPGNELLFDKFINSFQFLPYAETKFEKQTGGSNLFSVVAPSPINILKNKIISVKNRTDYYAFDSCRAMSYGVTALGLNKYYWTNERNNLLNEYARFHFNDSLAVKNIYGSDSMIYKKNVFNGTYEGREMLLKTLSNNSYTRIRIMQYADSVFIINAKGSNELVTDNKADTFFNSFRFSFENVSSTVFTSKTDLLLKDLQSADSIKSKAAADVLSKGFRFPEQDLQKMLDAFLYNYSNVNSNGLNVPLLLSQAITPYAGDVLLNFIKTNYPLVKREDLRMLMINMLSAFNDQQSYQILKGFLLTNPPVEDDYTIAISNFTRFPQMAATLFPDIAVKIKDDKLAPVILELTNLLIDSNRIQYNSIKEYEGAIINCGKKILAKFRDNNNENFHIAHNGAVLQMLVKMGQKQSRSVLNDLGELQNYNLSLLIIQAYIKNNQAVPTTILDWYCSTPNRRIELYDEFVKINKQSLFAGQYANQRSFADAFITVFTNDEIGNNTPTFYDMVAIKDATVKNKLTRYYIYKVTCQFRRSTETFTGIIGPFSPNTSEFSIKEGNELYILYRKTFDEKNVDKLFNDFTNQVKQMK